MKRKRHACQFCSENSLKQKRGDRRLEYNEQDKSPEIDANRFTDLAMGSRLVRFSTQFHAARNRKIGS